MRTGVVARQRNAAPIASPPSTAARCRPAPATSVRSARATKKPAPVAGQRDWLATANTRVVRTIQARPVDRLEADRSAMLALPPVPPLLGWRSQVRLGRDYYVRVASNDYSVDPTAIGRLVEVHADLDRVQVRLAGRLVGDHPRLWARGCTLTDTTHVETAARLRREFQQPRPRPVADELERDLADYDRAFGLTQDRGFGWDPGEVQR